MAWRRSSQSGIGHGREKKEEREGEKRGEGKGRGGIPGSLNAPWVSVDGPINDWSQNFNSDRFVIPITLIFNTYLEWIWGVPDVFVMSSSRVRPPVSTPEPSLPSILAPRLRCRPPSAALDVVVRYPVTHRPHRCCLSVVCGAPVRGADLQPENVARRKR